MMQSKREFVSSPILNSPFSEPDRHWHLDNKGVPTGEIVSGRRHSYRLIPIPRSEQSRKLSKNQADLDVQVEQKDNQNVKDIREEIGKWRLLPLEKRNITYTTQRLLCHWYAGKTDPRLFFCQVEAVETFIWLNEVAPRTSRGKHILDELKNANDYGHSLLPRMAAKMATGSGKTAVMAMMICYHTLNNVQQPKSNRFSKNFLVVTPGITIKDRLRVLVPSDPNNYYKSRSLVPTEMLEDVGRAQIVITNFHSFICRKTSNLSKTQREVLAGNDKFEDVVETPRQMLLRVCPELLRARNAIIFNDEAHHCYHMRKSDGDQEKLDLDERNEVERRTKDARVWISGIEALEQKVSVRSVYDLSATPFFLRGSGYPADQLFPWVTSDFSLMDAIESGIVKLPRVPVSDNSKDGPIFRTLYRHISKELRTREASQVHPDPKNLPVQLLGALQVLFSNYRKTFEKWRKSGITIPPVFIIVCNNTKTSKRIYDYVSGYEIQTRNGAKWKHGELDLFDNIGPDNQPLERMHTLLIDSTQIEGGDVLTPAFKRAAAHEIDKFKDEMRRAFPDRDTSKLTDAQILREVMNTVGKDGKLGEKIRCVVSVSMLTEGWDTNSVTHILGIRSFGTQLLCEQVVGRGLRRQDYSISEDEDSNRCFRPEYAEVLGVPFDFARGGKPADPVAPRKRKHIHHMPERIHLEIVYPRVVAYKKEILDDKIIAEFTQDSELVITDDDAPSLTKHKGIVGKSTSLHLEDLKKRRMNEVAFKLTNEVWQKFGGKFDEESVPPNRFRDLLPITKRWIDECLICQGNTFEQYLLFHPLAVKAAEKIYRACAPETREGKLVAVLDPRYPRGSSASVDFETPKILLHATRPYKCHINFAVCDSEWEISFCKILEGQPAVFSYVRNEHLGFEVPYEYQGSLHSYYPDFIVRINDRYDEYDMLNLVVEIKGLRDDKDSTKADTMKKLWVPAVNSDGRWGRWDFIEITEMQHASAQLAQFLPIPIAV